MYFLISCFTSISTLFAGYFSFISFRLPCNTVLPLFNIKISLQNSSIVAIWCADIIMYFPFFIKLIIIFFSISVLTGSSPLNGSSNTTNSGSCIIAVINCIFCWFPFDNFSAGICKYSSTFSTLAHSFIELIASSFCIPFNSAKYISWSNIFVFGYTPLSSGRYPNLTDFLSTGFPFQVISPLSFFIIPSNILIVVVFPAPLVPSKPYTPGFVKLKEILSTAFFPTNDFDTFLNSRLIFSFPLFFYFLWNTLYSATCLFSLHILTYLFLLV